jgi:flagellar L-ring protein precursor FlgH
MKRMIIGCAAVVVMTAGALSQDMRGNVQRSLFADPKATRLGDALMVLVVETSSASNDASTSADRQSDLSLNVAGKTGTSNIPEVSLGVGTGNSFKGTGATSSHGSVRAKLSARVDSVLANGDLLITAHRSITVNGEKQMITLSGIVRPADIQADNSVYSYSIAEAVIAFEGDGVVSRAQGPGWITKLLHWLF